MIDPVTRCALFLVLLGGPQAAAAETQTEFRIPAASTSEALVQLALQAKISIINPGLCLGRSPAISESLSLSRALQKLVGGACAFEFVEPRTVRIFALPPRRTAAPERGAAPIPVVSEVLVTTSRKETDIDHLSGSISVVSGEHAGALGAVDAGDLGVLLAGVVTTNLGPGRDKLLLRGLSDGVFTGRTQSTVGIFLDNVPLTYNAPDPDLRLADIQRVEVARGPQGALYGAGSVGGIYRLVANKPQFDVYSARAAVMWGSTQKGGQSHASEAMVNIPLLVDRLALRLVAYDEVQGGYVRNIALKRSAIDDTVRRGGRMAVRLQIDQSWRLDLSTAMQRLATADTHYVTPEHGRWRTRRIQETHRNAFDEGAITLDGSGAWGQLQSTTGLILHRYASDYDASSIVPMLDPTPAAAAVFFEHAQTRMLVNDTVLHSRNDQRARWLAGLYVSDIIDQKPSSLRVRHRRNVVDTLFDESRRDRTWDAAVYGEFSYDIGAGWSASAGGRAFRSTATHASVAHVRNEIRTQNRKLSFGGVSPTFSLQHTIGTEGLVYALYAEGYRSAGVNSIGFGRRSRVPRTFSPDHLQNHEVGLKAYLLDHRARLRAALFYERWRNIQSDQYNWFGRSFTVNVGVARDLGLEMEARYTVDRNLTLQGQVQLTAADLTRPNRDYVPNPANGLPGVPPVSAGGLVEYRKPLTSEIALLVIGQVGYVGRSHVTFASSSQVMGDYLSDRLSAELTSTHWSAGAFVDNATNASGDTFAFGNPFSLGRVRQVTPQRPRTLGVRLSASF